MTHQENYTFSKTFVDELIDAGFDGIPEMFRVNMNNAMKTERDQFLQADKYERTEDRLGYANGYKPKTIKSRVGEVTLDIPQVREGGFYPSSLEKGMRSERALLITLAEMYIQGVSTRKVSAIIEKMCGFEISAMQGSRATKQLDEILQQWRERPLGEMRYLFLDARYEKVRKNGQIRDAAVLNATGISPEGERQVLGVSVSLSELRVHWRDFLQSLKDCGLRGVKLITSDAHEGLGSARREIFGSIPWQRCHFHLQQNAGAYVPRQSMRAEVAADIRDIFNAPDRSMAEKYLQMVIQKYAKSAPRLSSWLEANLAEGFTVFDFPTKHRRFIRTTNSLERVNCEIRRRTRVVGIFPNETSCLRLISAILMKTIEKWQIGRRCCLDEN